MKLPIDVEGSLSDEAIYEVKDIKNLIDTAKSTKQTRIETEKNKTTYQQDLAAAKADWEKAKKGYEVLLKDQEATSEQVKDAKGKMEAAEKKYKDLGGITGSSLTKQENQAKKEAAKQLKQQELLAEQLLSIRRKTSRMKSTSWRMVLKRSWLRLTWTIEKNWMLLKTAQGLGNGARWKTDR